MISDWSKCTYVNPLFKDLLESVPAETRRQAGISFGIAHRIGEILDHKGWSQADFAKAAGKKEAEISKWMSGQHNFTVRTIAFIETVLGEEILSVKLYRKTKASTDMATMGKSSYKGNRDHSQYAPGLLNDEGKYYKKKKSTPLPE